jgi:hypothetical protein
MSQPRWQSVVGGKCSVGNESHAASTLPGLLYGGGIDKLSALPITTVVDIEAINLA